MTSTNKRGSIAGRQRLIFTPEGMYHIVQCNQVTVERRDYKIKKRGQKDGSQIDEQTQRGSPQN